MKITRLVFADIYRDGGSYRASFETDDGSTNTVLLKRSRMPDDEGLHHRWLFQYVGNERPEDCLPVVTGSQEERALLALLREFTSSATPDTSSATVSQHNEGNNSMTRLRELIKYIELREPCFPSDIIGRRF